MTTSTLRPVRPGSRHARRLASGALALAVAAAVVPSTSATAVPDGPTILGPVGTVSDAPEISWAPLAGATGYEVDVDNNDDFKSREFSAATVNTVVHVSKPLPEGTYRFRVRAKDASGWGAWSTSEFTARKGESPVLTAPDQDAFLSQPEEPPVLQWRPVRGARSYTIQTATEPNFVSPTTWTTSATSYSVPFNQTPGVTHHWRVRANLDSSVTTDWSLARRYQLGTLDRPELVGPGHLENVEEVVLEWKPVPGATHYQLQVDSDEDFQNLYDSQTRIVSTRYSPPKTYTNGTYYWRVRAVDADGNTSEWSHAIPREIGRDANGDPILSDVELSEPAEFTRAWRPRPTLVHPADTTAGGPTVGDDFYLQWTPVRLASSYEIYMHTDPVALTNVAACATTQGTTFTPHKACMPAGEGIRYYWRVRALDAPSNEKGIFSDTSSFIYSPSRFQLLSPAAGETVRVPTISWAPMQGVTLYTVEILRNGSPVPNASAETRATSWTPSRRLNVSPSDVLQVRLTGVDDNGSRTTSQTLGRFSVDPAAGPTFDLDPGEGYPSPVTVRAAHLVWGEVPGADHYRIRVRKTTNDAQFLDSWGPLTSTKWPYPAATDPSVTSLAPGSYEWWVDAYDANSARIFDGWGAGQRQMFTIAEPGAVTGQQVAVSGTALDGGNVCSLDLGPHRTDWCDGLPTTPVLDWEPVPGATHYKVWVSKDSDFTSGIVVDGDRAENRTANTRWISQTALPDSEAGSAYYWYIQPCVFTYCAVSPRSTVDVADHAFRKTSPKVKLSTPVADATVAAQQVTFRWEDYLTTNLDHEHAHERTSQAFPAPTDPQREVSDQAARQYTIQVSRTPAFNGADVIDTATVDQTTYTSSSKFYPEGDLYWRVQALDAAGNRLGYGTAQKFTKKSPAPTGLVPSAGGEFNTQTAPFQWDNLPYTSTYSLEVAKVNASEVSPVADNNFTPTTKVLSVDGLKRARFTGTEATVLPPSAPGEVYLWRVRHVPLSGSAGQWSTPAQFRVPPVAPTPQSPAPGAVTGPRSTVVRWTPVDTAYRHRVSLRKVGTSTVTSSGETVATAWAVPIALTEDAQYEWQVEALDARSRSVGSTDWQRFTVAGPPAVRTAPVITGDLVLGGRLDVRDPEWSLPGVVNTYQWQRKGRSIAGATGKSYTVTAADVGTAITVVVTGSSPDSGVATLTTAAVTPLAGPAPRATVQPSLPAKVVVGVEVEAGAPVWESQDVTVKWQWLRDGKNIRSATKPTYTPVKADVGTLLSVQVTGTSPGRLPAVLTSAPVGVWASPTVPPTKVPGGSTGGGTGSGTGTSTKKTSTTTVAKPKKVRLKGKKSKTAKVVVTVRTGGKAAKGKVKLYVKGKVVGTGTLKANGKVKITTKKLKKGTHKVTAKYLGNASTKASKSKVVKLKVVK